MVNLKIDQGQLNSAKLMLAAVGKSADPIIYRSINKSIDNTQVKAVDLIYKVLNLTKTRIKKDFTKYKAYSKKLSGQLLAAGLPVGFMSFSGTNQLKSGGVSYKIKRIGTRQKMKHAFIARGRGGKEQVFEREKWKGRPWIRGYPYWKMPDDYRLGLDRLAAVAIEDYYKDPRIFDPVQLYAAFRLQVNMESQIDFELSKL